MYFVLSQLLKSDSEVFIWKKKQHFWVSVARGCTLLPLLFFSAAVKLLLFLLALLSTPYSLINDPDPDIQTINWLPASLTVEWSLKNSQRYGNTPALSAFLAQPVFPPTRSESLLVFCMFSEVFQLCFCLSRSYSRLLAGPKKLSFKAWRSLMREKQTRPLKQRPSPESAVCRKPQASQFGNECASWTSERGVKEEKWVKKRRRRSGHEPQKSQNLADRPTTAHCIIFFSKIRWWQQCGPRWKILTSLHSDKNPLCPSHRSLAVVLHGNVTMLRKTWLRSYTLAVLGNSIVHKHLRW